MKKIGFIGGTDKTDLISYIAKTLDDLNKHTLVVDTSIMQKTRFVMPTINPTKAYITNYENIDFAVGFENMDELLEYLGKESEEKLKYDYMLIDIDRIKAINAFGIDDTTDNYFVTTFDMYSLQRGLKILKSLPNPMTFSKVLLNYNMKKEDEEYLLYLTADAKVMWDKFSIYMPILDENQQAIEENQRVYRLRLKRLVQEYQDGIIYIVQNIVKDYSINKIKKQIKD